MLYKIFLNKTCLEHYASIMVSESLFKPVKVLSCNTVTQKHLQKLKKNNLHLKTQDI